MPCFCTVPADVARMSLAPGVAILPPPPLALRMVAAFPALAAEPRLDIAIAAGMAMKLPDIALGGGPLMAIGMTLSMAVGSFALDDLPMLEMQMAQAGESFQRNIWPRLGWLTTLKVQPLLNMAIVARLVLDLSAMGLDPFAMGAAPPAPMMHSARFSLSSPKLAMARLLAGLPMLGAMMPALALPPLGETGALPALGNRLNALAGLTPPSLAIPFPVMLKLAMALESLATIRMAFGDVSPATFQRLDAMLRMWSTFPLPLPLPLLPLAARLAALPPLETIRLGEAMAGRMGAVLATPFTPPKLAILPFLNVMLALQAGLKLAVNLEPFDQCALCPCA